MTNTLTISFYEFRKPGTEDFMCGFTATVDSFSQYTIAEPTWEAFREAYPSLESVLEDVLDDSATDHLEIDYEVNESGMPVATEPHADQSAFIEFRNYKHIYP